MNKLKKLTKDNEKKIFWDNSTLDKADVVLFGMPYDQTASYKKGTTKAFASMRNEAEATEPYSPILDKYVTDYKIHDAGDLKIENLKPEQAYKQVYEYTKKLVEKNKMFIGIGGEHSMTHPEVRAVFEKYPDLVLLHFDAHTDLRDEYQGHFHSHANIVKRCYDFLGNGKIFSFGIRSGDKTEFQMYKDGKVYCEQSDVKTVNKILSKVKNKPVFITIDVDILDPSIMPGTGTTEAGGITFKELLEAVHSFKKLKNIVGADIMELAPQWDQSLQSTSVAVKLLRELLITIMFSKNKH